MYIDLVIIEEPKSEDIAIVRNLPPLDVYTYFGLGTHPMVTILA